MVIEILNARSFLDDRINAHKGILKLQRVTAKEATVGAKYTKSKAFSVFSHRNNTTHHNTIQRPDSDAGDKCFFCVVLRNAISRGGRETQIQFW